MAGIVSAANSLVGGNANDQVGGAGIVLLSNGNYVVPSSTWNGNRGAVTWGSGISGVAGTVSAANSLVGSIANDRVGDLGVTVLSNGNYVVSSLSWNGNRGAVTWGSGTSGVAGTVSAANSLVGSNANDRVGGSGITLLSNGNYVVRSSSWQSNRGAVTLGSGTGGVAGAVSAANSLVGSIANDSVGNGGITALTNGNYVVRSPNWNGNRGAVTWGSGTSGVFGAVSASNSLVGGNANDRIGVSGIMELANGNYVVASPGWNSNRGAATWGSGTSGTVGPVSTANSLVGSNANDRVGSGVSALSNGNYVVSSVSWNASRGAMTWGSGTSGVTGVVSAANSLVGSVTGDLVGNAGVTLLSNGNYVVNSAIWNGGRGAVTWGSGTSGVAGTVSAANSLVGGAANDLIGNGGITALSNGNYVVRSINWNGRRGAVTFGSGTSGVAGIVSATNSLVGSNVDDRVGNAGIVVLSAGNYLVLSSNWNSNRGAVTWASDTSGVTGAVSAINSLVGGNANDRVISGGITLLSNGNYVVRSSMWNGDRGAVTWGSGTSGVVGTVSATNSLVGSTPGDFVGNLGITELSDGNFVVSSVDWSDSRGAVTWGSGTGGVSGTVSSANSLVGGNANDRVGSFGILAFGSGKYLVRSPEWGQNRGAATLGSGVGGVSGEVSATNSLVGSVADQQVGNFFALLEAGETILTHARSTSTSPGRVIIGLTDPNQLTFERAIGQTMTIKPGFITRTLNAGTAVQLEATTDIIVNSAIAVSNPSGDGGALSLSAGRSILLNANVTTDNGNITLAANTGGSQPGLVAANRDPGPAFITMANDAAINVGTGTATIRMGDGADIGDAPSGAITLGNITAGRIDVRSFGSSSDSDIVVRAGAVLTASGTGRAIDLAALGGEVRNLASDAGLMLTGGGHFGIFAATPAGSQIGTPAAFIRRYNVANAAAYDALNPAGNFAAFRFAPVLQVTVDDASRIYGNANPAFTFNVTGFQFGDGLADLTGAPALTTPATASSNVGQFSIEAALGTLLSEQGYQFQFNPGQLTITPRPITVTADDVSRIYGNANPALTFTVGGQGLVNGDTLSGVLATTASATTGVGAVPITQGTLAAGPNYAVSFVNGQLTITPRPITVTADDLAKLAGQVDPPLTFTITGEGLVNNDLLSGSMVRDPGENQGTFAIRQGTLNAGQNYLVTFVNGALVISAAPPPPPPPPPPAVTLVSPLLTSAANREGAVNARSPNPAVLDRPEELDALGGCPSEGEKQRPAADLEHASDIIQL